MAWFDVMQALGQGAAQGAQTFQALKTRQLEQERATRLEQRQVEQLNRQVETEQRSRALEELKEQDPFNLDPAWVAANAKYVQPFIRKSGQGSWEVKMSDQQRKQLKVATLQTEQAERQLTRKTTAQDMVSGPAFATMPIKDKTRLLIEAEIPMEAWGAHLSDAELAQAAKASPKFIQEMATLEPQLRSRERIAGMELSGAAARTAQAQQQALQMAYLRAAQRLREMLAKQEISAEDYQTELTNLQAQFGMGSTFTVTPQE